MQIETGKEKKIHNPCQAHNLSCMKLKLSSIPPPLSRTIITTGSSSELVKFSFHYPFLLQFLQTILSLICRIKSISVSITLCSLQLNYFGHHEICFETQVPVLIIFVLIIYHYYEDHVPTVIPRKCLILIDVARNLNNGNNNVLYRVNKF